MITSESHKELYAPFEKDRCDALKNSTNLTDAELDDLGVDRARGGGVNDSDTYLIDSTPVDPETEPIGDKIDVRALPGHD